MLIDEPSRRGLGLSPAPVAYSDIGFGAVKPIGKRRFAVS